MKDHQLEKLLDNLRMFTITGDSEYKQSVIQLMDCVYYFDNSICMRSKRILEMNGFLVYKDGIETKRGFIQAPII